MRLKTLETYVLNTLEQNKRARSDDFVLYGSVLKQLGVDLNKPLSLFLATAKDLKMPIFESVTRCRRKILETRPDLEPDETFFKRIEETENYKNYNKN